MIWIIIGILAVGMAFVCYACLVVGSRNDRRDDE